MDQIKSPKMEYLKVEDCRKSKKRSPKTNKEATMNKENL